MKWKYAGSPIPPPYTVKREKIIKIAKEYNCKIFIETGTYLGATTYEMMQYFKKLYSIELSTQLYEMAVSKFRKYSKVNILKGDSSYLMNDLVKNIDDTTLFWLDGHYSGGITARGESDCPIFKELEAIFTTKEKYVIMIDDARCFGNLHEPDYPTISELNEFVQKNSPRKMILNIEIDIITFLPII